VTYEAISQDVKDFIATHIDSVEQLEVLLLLQNDATQEWSAESLAKELRIDAAWAGARLIDLFGRGLLSVRESPDFLYHFNPKFSQSTRIVSQLAETYAQRRVSVINLIYSKPLDNILVFAEAFRLKKEKPDG
jgi:hypothetical protein